MLRAISIISRSGGSRTSSPSPGGSPRTTRPPASCTSC
jgi:hypothetical protein